MKDVADRLGFAPVDADRRPQEKREIHPRQPHFARTAEHRRQHQRADEAANELRRQGGHERSASRTASAGSISSEKSPTSLARATSRSISAVDSSMRPARASALTSQNEQFRKHPSPPGRPSSAR